MIKNITLFKDKYIQIAQQETDKQTSIITYNRNRYKHKH